MRVIRYEHSQTATHWALRWLAITMVSEWWCSRRRDSIPTTCAIHHSYFSLPTVQGQNNDATTPRLCLHWPSRPTIAQECHALSYDHNKYCSAWPLRWSQRPYHCTCFSHPYIFGTMWYGDAISTRNIPGMVHWSRLDVIVIVFVRMYRLWWVSHSSRWIAICVFHWLFALFVLCHASILFSQNLFFTCFSLFSHTMAQTYSMMAIRLITYLMVILNIFQYRGNLSWLRLGFASTPPRQISTILENINIPIRYLIHIFHQCRYQWWKARV